MKPMQRFLIFAGVLLLVVVGLAACQQDQPPTTVEVTRLATVEVPVPGPTEIVELEVTRVVTVTVETMPAVTVPFQADWLASGHADASAEAFVHWDNEDPKEVPVGCAKCHSTPGFLDFLGADGSAAMTVDAAAPTGTVISCEACHNSGTQALTSVVFPSGLEVAGLGPEARCMQCHQGRASTPRVDQSIADAGLTAEDEDTVSPDLGFTNIHYFAAAATQFGTLAMGGYEYAGEAYDGRFDHVPGYNTCVDCHNPHTLEVNFDECTACHTDLRTADDLVDIRMAGSMVDYDGDGDISEGIYYEIEDMRAVLYQAMQAYATEVSGVGLVYTADSHPYFFIDTNGDGAADEAEVNSDNRFNAWTPRLAKAAYNYQVSLKDPGRFAHGGKYIIELLYDSIANLNEAISTPIDMSLMNRIDDGHFAASEEAFRHWDEDGEVPGSCSRCHSAAGLPLYIEQGVAIAQEPSGGLNCTTCHNDLTSFSRYEVAEVTFPSGLKLSNSEDDLDSNLCINCHQGRESTVSVNRAIGNTADDEVSESLRFINVHYFAAGATLFGTEAQGAYEYADQTYVGRNVHVGAFDSCVECHSTHELSVRVSECAECHETVESGEDLVNIRMVNEDGTPEVDYDGDGDVTEGIAGEIATLQEVLYGAMQNYAATTIGTGIVYSSARHPYFFIDLNGDGVADPDEINSDNRYATWTPRLLRGAYNYQYMSKDPGQFAHNPMYAIQILYDSIADLGGDVAAMTRPETPAP